MRGASEDRVVEREGRFVVVLGDGERAAPSDAHVAALARRMHRAVAPMSPKDVYLFVRDLDTDLDWESDDAEEEIEEGDAEDWRLQVAGLSQVATDLVQRYAVGEESPTLGHPLTSYSFETRALAKLALMVDRVHRRATADDVLRCLSRALDEPRLHVGVTRMDRLAPLRVEKIEVRDEPLGIGCSQWSELVRRVETTIDGSISQLVCLFDEWAVAVDVVHHHWRSKGMTVHGWTVSEPAILVHRLLPDCELRFHRQAPSHGGVVQLHHSALHGDWPWWVGRAATRVAAHLFMGVSEERIVLEMRPPPAMPSTGDKRCAPLLERWVKSARSLGVRAPTLLRELPLPDDGDCLRTADGRLHTCRAHSLEDMERLETRRIFAGRLGVEYAKQMATRTAGDPSVGVFAVRCDGATVAAFAVVLYACVFHDGDHGVAVMVDSFAVDASHEGTGIGGRVYHELVRELAARHAPSRRHVVFAQCLRTSALARHFWVDKLDDSGEARSLLLQACNLDPHHVALQSESVCSARAREYYL